jgi:hypothetical protein
MKKLVSTFALFVLFLTCTVGRAQEKSSATEKAKPITPVRLQVVLTEFDGEKKVATLPYAFLIYSEQVGHTGYSTFTRVGVRVPVPGVGKDGQAQFADVGSNIDCGVQTEEDGRFTVHLSFERSSLYFQGRGEEKGVIKTAEAGQPYIPTIRTQTWVVLKDGQTLEALMAADPLNGHVFRINVTLNVQK